MIRIVNSEKVSEAPKYMISVEGMDSFQNTYIKKSTDSRSTMQEQTTFAGTCFVQSSKPFHIVQVSPEFAAYFGYGVEELHGRSMKLLQGPDCSTIRFEDIIKALKFGTQQELEVDVDKKDSSRARARIKASIMSTLEKNMESLARISMMKSDVCSFTDVADVEDNNPPVLPDAFHDALNTRPCHVQQTHQPLKVPGNVLSTATQPTLVQSDNNEVITSQLRCMLSQESCRICKALLANEKEIQATRAKAVPPTASPIKFDGVSANVPLELVARCARKALVSIRSVCDDGDGGWDGARAALALRLVEAEVLPQAGRWHRRDLAPMLEATWRAVFRALRRL